MAPFLRMLLENSVYSAMAAVIVLAARFVLRKAPRMFSYVLWAAVFFRLVCPVPLDTGIGVIPELSALRSALTAPSDISLPAENLPEALPADGPAQTAQITEATSSPQSAIHDSGAAIPGPAQNTKSIDTAGILFAVWAAGASLSAGSYAISYLRLRRRIKTAVRVGNKGSIIYESDRIDTAFARGIFRPRIYVPLSAEYDTGLDGRYRMLIRHEQIHIRRGDNIVKPLALLITCAYWFSPTAWLSYFLMCRDMEMSCDEAVIRDFGDKHKGGYCKMLLDFGTNKNLSAQTAFGECAAERRIKHLLFYKKPSVISITAAVLIVSLSLTACIGTASAPDHIPVVSGTNVSAADAADNEDTADARDGTDAQELVFPDLLASYSTNYNEANVARTSNLCLAADYIEGSVVMPGEVFSFNKVVGKWIPERGFCKADTYPNEDFPGGYGGGVTQTASTLYYCAVKADLEIIMRTPGKYLMPQIFTEQSGRDDAACGKEAVVMNNEDFEPVDMQFRNTKEKPICIRTHYAEGVLTFGLWGTWDGFTAEQRYMPGTAEDVVGYKVLYRRYTDGKNEIPGQDGRTIQIYRVVYYQDKPYEGERIETERYLESVQTYDPMDRIIYVESPPDGFEFDTPYSRDKIPE